jgi:3',5'-cyclic AMP phosphodiesterase CpdA
MSRILHLSDLHFGAVDQRLVEPVLRLAADLEPEATVISGDLTQRARTDQFQAARQFIDRLPGSMLVVPGNHDVPLWNLPLRLVSPLLRFRRDFAEETEPGIILPDAVVQGVNTANPYVWKAGRLTAASLDRLRSAFVSAPKHAARVAVMHHAPVPAADGTPADMAEPQAVLAALADTGTDIVLSGHTHMPQSIPGGSESGILFLQTGTTISTRLKTGANDFSLIDIRQGQVLVRSWIARRDESFVEAPPVLFNKTVGGWQLRDR